MADILDRTVTITLKAANDAYVQSINAAAKATDAAIASMNSAVQGADKSFQSLTSTVTASGSATTAAATNTQVLAAAIEQTSKNFQANAAAAVSAATTTQQVATAASATATAENNAAAATQKTTDAVKAQATAAGDAATKMQTAGAAVADAGTKASTASENLKEAGAKASTAGAFFSGLKDEAVKLVPGLGSVLSMATGVAGGLGALQIAQKVGAWLLDVGEKALTSSGQMAKISDSIAKVKSSIEDLIGRGIQLLASAITETIGPVLDHLVDWVTEAMKWLKALADWFQSSGTASAIFQSVLSTLATLFAPVTKAVQELWENLQEKFKQIQAFLEQHPAIWAAVLNGIALTVAGFAGALKVAFEAVGLIIQTVVFLVKQQFQLFVAALSGLADAASWVWDKLKTGVQAVSDFFVKIFSDLPRPVQDAFKAVADAIANWTRPILQFISDMIAKIPGLSSYKATFDSVSASLTTFGQKIVEGTAAQKAANDAADAAKKKAEDLAKAQQQLGIMTADAAAQATQSALGLAATFQKLSDSGTQNLAQLSIAAEKVYNDLESTRKSIEASGTAAQKAALDAQIKNIQAWAAAHGVALTEVKQALASMPAAIAQAAAAPGWAALTAQLQKIGYVSEASVAKAATDAALAWQTFTRSTSFNTAESAQVIQGTYTDLMKRIDQAQQLGYTAEANRLSQEAMNVRQYADARGVILKEDVQLWNDVQKAIAAIPPTIQVLDKAIADMGTAANESFQKIIEASQRVKFQTDADIKSQLDSTIGAYNMMVNIAGQSDAQRLRATQAYYADLKTQIDQNGVYYTEAQRAQVQTALQSLMEFAKAHGATLETVKTQHQQTTEQVSTLWTNLGQNMSRSIRQAAGQMADALISGDKSFGEMMKSMLQSIEKAIIQTFLQTGLDAVMGFIGKALTGSGGLLSSLGDVVKKFTDVGKSASDAAKTASDSMQNVSGSAGGGLSSALGGIGGITNVVTGAISAVTGIIGIFQQKGQTKVLENIQNLLIWILEDTRGTIVPALNLAIIPRMDQMLNWQVQIWDQLSRGFNDLREKADGLWLMLNDHLNRIEFNVLPSIRDAITAGAGGVVSFNLQPLLDATNAGTAAVVNAMNAAAATIVDAIRGIGSIPATITNNIPSVGGASGDLSPVTNLLSQIQSALTQGSLRPNVTLNVEAGATPQDVANTIVKQLQLAGVIR